MGRAGRGRADGDGSRRAEPLDYDSVHRELLRIRRANGLDIAAVREHGEHLQMLPAVDDELGARNESKSNRAAATVQVIRCATQRGISDFRSVIILKHTLITVDQRLLAKDRREKAKAELHLSDTSEAYFDKLVKSAYEHLASTLLDAVRSPCRRGPNQSIVDAAVEVFRSSASQLQVLHSMGHAVPADIRRAAEIVFGEHFSDGVARLVRIGVPTDLAPGLLVSLAWLRVAPELTFAGRMTFKSRDEILALPIQPFDYFALTAYHEVYAPIVLEYLRDQQKWGWSMLTDDQSSERDR